MASSTGIGIHNAKLTASKQVQSLQGNTYIDHRTHRQVPARRGRGTPPTKMVFLGSKGWEPSITKSLSFRFHGRIWTCKYPEEKKACICSQSRSTLWIGNMKAACCLYGMDYHISSVQASQWKLNSAQNMYICCTVTGNPSFWQTKQVQQYWNGPRTFALS